MARQTNGTTDSLQSSAGINFASATLVSISFWLYWNAFANDNGLALESASYDTGVDGDMGVQVLPNSVGGLYRVGVKGTAGYNYTQFVRPSAATDHHYLVNIDVGHATEEIRAVYIDGSSQALTPGGGANNTGGFGSRVIHLMSRDASSLFGAGNISELALWTGINLSGANAVSLAAGTLPTSIESGNLLYYNKLCGTTSPEPATIGSVSMTVTGATFVAHPSAVSGSCSATPITGLRPAICF